jgi:hypothetical protein
MASYREVCNPLQIMSRDIKLADRIYYVQEVRLQVVGPPGPEMRELLSDLELRRARLREEICRLGDFRAGSIGAIVRRCGKPGCRCAQPDDPGHGPNLRLTYKIKGKTYSESLAAIPDRRKAQREIAEFRNFQRLCREFIDVNAKICLLRRDSSQ